MVDDMLPSDDENDCAMLGQGTEELELDGDDDYASDEAEVDEGGEPHMAGGEGEGEGEGGENPSLPTDSAVAARVRELSMLQAEHVGRLTKAELVEHLEVRGRGRRVARNNSKSEHAECLVQTLREQVAVNKDLVAARLAKQSSAAAATSQQQPRRGEKTKKGKNERMWLPLDPSKIDRPVHAGDVAFRPSPSVGLRAAAHPFKWFNKFLTKEFRLLLVANTNKYKGYVAASGSNKYAYAAPIQLIDVDFFLAMQFLNALNPVPSFRSVHSVSWSRKGVRAADLLPRDRWVQMRALIHISAPLEAPSPGTAKWDVLHKVRPLIDHLLDNSQANVIASKACSIDEMTIGFQGHHGALKQRCHRYKRAGDGFQADALCLDGGYLLAFAFRGDNTIPVYNPSFSTLHNRCIHILSQLKEDGSHLFWDNLYPSLDVVAAIAQGPEYTAVVPAGRLHGNTVTVKLPKILSTGTARINRGVPVACRQPDKAKMAKKQKEAMDELKATKPEEVLKVMMTADTPRILCILYFDNASVHLFSTIHTAARFVEVSYKRWDAATRDTVMVTAKRVEAIHDYNQNMNNVDRFDQISNGYNLDGTGWRDRKWWHPIFKCLLKAAADQAYLLYKRQFELEAKAAEEAAAIQAALDERVRSLGSPSSRTRRYAISRPVASIVLHCHSQPRRPHFCLYSRTTEGPDAHMGGKKKGKKQPMAHSVFLEKVSEGLFIEGYNSARSNPVNHIDLDAYTLEDLEDATQQLRGGRTQATSARRMHSSFEAGHLIPLPFTRPDHLIAPAPPAGKNPQYCCLGPFCPHAVDNAPSVSHRHQQQARSRAAKGVWCMACERVFHADCFSVYHRDTASYNDVVAKSKKKTSAGSRSRPLHTRKQVNGKRRRLGGASTMSSSTGSSSNSRSSCSISARADGASCTLGGSSSSGEEEANATHGMEGLDDVDLLLRLHRVRHDA